MRRLSCILVVLLVVPVFNVWAQTSAEVSNINMQVENCEECNAVRKVIYREIQGFFKGSPQQVLSCYDADNFVGYTVASDDPKEWRIAGVGREFIETYASNAVNMPKNMADKQILRHAAEVQHVEITGDHAIAISRQWYVLPDGDEGETRNAQFESVFMLHKKNGEWKINGFLSQASRQAD